LNCGITLNAPKSTWSPNITHNTWHRNYIREPRDASNENGRRRVRCGTTGGDRSTNIIALKPFKPETCRTRNQWRRAAGTRETSREPFGGHSVRERTPQQHNRRPTRPFIFVSDFAAVCCDRRSARFLTLRPGVIRRVRLFRKVSAVARFFVPVNSYLLAKLVVTVVEGINVKTNCTYKLQSYIHVLRSSPH